LRPEAHVAQPTLALPALLKIALRRFGLRSTAVEVRQPDRDSTAERSYDPQDDIIKSVAEGFRVIRERICSGGKGWGEQ
jgi:hypothetical protein